MNLVLRSIAAGLAACIFGASPAPAQTGATIAIPVPGAEKVETTRIRYMCGTLAVEATYINAGPVSLATLSWKGEFVVASDVIAASGARYAGGRYIWWTRGDRADLYDLTKGDGTTGVSCEPVK